MTAPRLRIDERLDAVMRALGLRRAHFGTGVATELDRFMRQRPESVATLTLLNCARFPVPTLSALGSHVLAFGGDAGLHGEALAGAAAQLADAQVHTFNDTFAAAWTDLAADRAEPIGDAMLAFLRDNEAEHPADRLSGPLQGEAGGIFYEVTGEGPAVILFPAMLAPSQWEPLRERLETDFAVVRLGGPNIGAVAMLDARGRDPSWRRVLRGMLADAGIGPGERLLEVGCGGGVNAHWLAAEALCARPVVALDLNPFLLREAAMLAKHLGVADAIEFRQGNAEALPFEDDSFDAVLSVTVIEECDADKAIAEMVRVVRPGGAVMIKVRACDRPLFWNLDVEPPIRAKAEAPLVQVEPKGCADAGLARRMIAAGLRQVIAYPAYHGAPVLAAFYEPVVLARMNEAERAAWAEAKAAARADGSYGMMHPAHCAIGRKPDNREGPQ